MSHSSNLLVFAYHKTHLYLDGYVEERKGRKNVKDVNNYYVIKLRKAKDDRIVLLAFIFKWIMVLNSKNRYALCYK